MLIKAYEYLALSPSASLPRIMEVFNKTALEVCEGQQYDMDFESQARVSLQEYLHMIKSKTAVLLAASLKIGALSGGSSDSDAGYLADFGENIGMAFQLQDDLLDVYGTLEQFGKQPGNDIASNKKTYLLLTAMDMAHGKLLDTLQYWIDQKIFNREEKVSQVISVFDALGIKKITEDRINLFYDLAMQSLEKVSGSNLRKQPLIQFAEMMMNRKK
jgi:geranylgeranyl diphosphate synthase type II